MDFNIEDEKRYIVNVGSIGQPRDDDFRASYCIYDNEKQDVFFRKVPFDIESYRRELAKAKIPENSSYFIEFYLTRTSKPLRDTIGFRELSAEQAIFGAEEVKSLECEVEKLRRSKKLLLIIIFLCVSVCLGLALLYAKISANNRSIAEAARIAEEKLAKKNKTIYDGIRRDFALLPPAQETEIILMPAIGEATSQKPFDGWSVELFHPDKQQVFCEIFPDKKQGDLPSFRIVSKSTDEIILKYKPLPVRRGMRFSASAQFKKISLEAGHIALCLLLEKPDGTTEVLAQNIPDEILSSDSWTRRTSITIGKDDAIRSEGMLYYAIKGNFSGEVLVRKCSLVEKK